MSLDTIRITGLRADGVHGVYPQEKVTPQPFVVDATLELDLGAAAVTDDVEQTVDYAELAGRIRAVVEGETVELIETLAERVCRVCLADPRVRCAEVTVHKPAAAASFGAADVTVTLRREAR